MENAFNSDFVSSSHTGILKCNYNTTLSVPCEENPSPLQMAAGL